MSKLTLEQACAEMVQIQDWLATQAELRQRAELPAHDRQKELQGFILAQAFPKQPKEGGTTIEINGFRLKCQQDITRKLDEAVLTSLQKMLLTLKVPLDKLVKRKPELSVKVYRTLTPPQRKQFDRCLTITPANPKLEIIPYAK